MLHLSSQSATPPPSVAAALDAEAAACQRPASVRRSLRAVARDVLAGRPPALEWAPAHPAGRGVASPLPLGAHAPRPVALIVDHGLRPGSRADADVAATLATSLGLQPRVVTLAWRDGPPRVEAASRAARDLRLVALARAAADAGVSHVLTAHHADDQVETLLLRITRCSGLQGLAGIPEVRELAEGLDLAHDDSGGPGPPAAIPLLVRPLLGTRKAELLALAQETGLAWVPDPSNAMPSANDRNRMRALLGGPPAAAAGLAVDPKCHEAILEWEEVSGDALALSAAARRTGDAWHAEAAAALAAACLPGQAGRVAVAPLVACSPPAAGAALGSLMDAACPRARPSGVGGAVKQLHARMAGGALVGGFTAAGCLVAPLAGSRGAVITFQQEAARRHPLPSA